MSLLFGSQTPAEKEWAALQKREARYLQRQDEEKQSLLNKRLKEAVPVKVQNTLDLAFYKAFQTVFEKGTGFIEKTYNKDKKEFDYKMNAYAASLKENRKNIKAFSRRAMAAKNKNLALSGIEGIGTGLLGIGIPDIPLFTAVILKGIYETAASFGYSYDTKEEQEFILKLIGVSLSHGEALKKGNQEIDQWIGAGQRFGGGYSFLLKETADCLSKELLIMKFIQGIPLVGVVGGLSDSFYLKKILDYAALKYQRRFLTDRTKKK